MNQKNDFFNLNSDEDEEEDRKKEELSIKKWDWEREENRALYYPKPTSFTNHKRPLISLDYDDDNDNAEIFDQNFKKFKHCNENKKNCEFFIEKIKNDEIKNGEKVRLEYKLIGHTNSVNRIYWGKHGSNKNRLLSSSMDGKIIIWDLNDLKTRVFSDVHTRSVREAIWSNDESEIASVSYDQSSALIDAEYGKEKSRLKYKNHLTAIVNHLSDAHIYLVGSRDEILTWDTRSNKPAKVYKSHMGQVQDLAFLNEREFVSCGDVVSKESAEYSIMVWDYSTKASISQQIFHEKYVCTCVKKHPNKSLFLAQTHGNYIAEFSSNSPFKMNKFKRFEANGHSTESYWIGFDLNLNGNILASGSNDGCVYIYNFNTSKLMHKINVFNRSVYNQPCMDVKFNSSLNRQLIAASGWSGEIKIFDVLNNF